MVRWLTLTVVVIGVAGFSRVHLPRLFDAISPLTTAFSITVAAIFVRLNRGMPTLEWKNIEASRRQRLTSQIVALNLEYARILAILASGLALLVTISVCGKHQIENDWPKWLQLCGSGLMGGLVALSVCRMAYVVWRDYDIVRLQKEIIDASAASELTESERRLASDKVAEMRSAGLRRFPVAERTAWGE